MCISKFKNRGEVKEDNYGEVRVFLFKIMKCLIGIILISAMLFAAACIVYISSLCEGDYGYLWCFICIATALCIILSLVILFSLVNSLKYEWRSMLEVDAVKDFKKGEYQTYKDHLEKELMGLKEKVNELKKKIEIPVKP